jgi:tetratricopeptide (TPR) repeat protein
MTRSSMAITMLNLGRLTDAIAGFERCEAVCAGDPDYGSGITGFNIHGLLLSVHAVCLVCQGRPTDALSLVERAVELARERRDHEIAGAASASGFGACEMLGDAPGALAYAREQMRSVEAGADGLRQFALTTLGRAHLMQGEWEIASDALQASLDLTRKVRTGLGYEALILAFLADARLAAGDLGGARERADEAVAVARRRQTALSEIVALLARARVGLATDGASPAVERDLDDATAVVAQTTARGYLPDIHLERARLAARRGDARERERHLREAHRLLVEMGATLRVERLAAEMGG